MFIKFSRHIIVNWCVLPLVRGKDVDVFSLFSPHITFGLVTRYGSSSLEHLFGSVGVWRLVTSWMENVIQGRIGLCRGVETRITST